MTQPIDINIPDIEKELSKLWKQAEDQKQAKACLFNLVIYANEAKRVKFLQEFSDNILAKFPCRLIFIHSDQLATKSYFSVDVSTVMSGNIENRSTIACDQILIRASKDQLFRVPFIIIPHLERDLPIFLLWGQNPLEDHVIYPALQPYATRVIFDSECSDNLNLFCKEMLMGMDSLGIDAIDLNWALISNWRDMLRQLFSGQEMISKLQNCKSIIINYNDCKDHPELHTESLRYPEIRAIYLQGWLASRLKWRFRSLEIFKTSTIINYFSPITEVTVALSPMENPELPPGTILSMEFTMKDGSSYEIIRKEKLSQVVVHSFNENECQLPFTLPLPSSHKGMNFIQEIFYNPAGEQFDQMIELVSKLDFDLIKCER